MHKMRRRGFLAAIATVVATPLSLLHKSPAAVEFPLPCRMKVTESIYFVGNTKVWVEPGCAILDNREVLKGSI